jgi:lipid-A-disaccharide synthase
LRVFLSTADASGDLHAAALVEALRARLAERGERLHIFGLGGASLEAAGLRPLARQAELAVAGLVEVLTSAPRMIRSYTKLRRALRREDPDLAIFIDSPDLNIPLAAVAKRADVPVLYYIAPQIWAWRTGRVQKLIRRVDHLGVIFPFEEPLMRRAGVPTTFVGHPLVERLTEFRRRLNRAVVGAELDLDLDRPILGLLPGSRHNEVQGNLPIMLETADLLRERMPGLQVQLMLAPTLLDSAPRVPEYVRVVSGRSHEAMAVSTALLAAPGTVTVEAALLGVPLVVTHRVNRFSFEIARRVSRVPSSCMINLIADRGIVAEYIQEMARPPALALALQRLLCNPVERETLCRSLEEATSRLGGPGAAARMAELALELAGAH